MTFVQLFMNFYTTVVSEIFFSALKLIGMSTLENNVIRKWQTGIVEVFRSWAKTRFAVAMPSRVYNFSRESFSFYYILYRFRKKPKLLGSIGLGTIMQETRLLVLVAINSWYRLYPSILDIKKNLFPQCPEIFFNKKEKDLQQRNIVRENNCMTYITNIFSFALFSLKNGSKIFSNH